MKTRSRNTAIDQVLSKDSCVLWAADIFSYVQGTNIPLQAANPCLKAQPSFDLFCIILHVG